MRDNSHEPAGRVATIGTFDGLHRGHQAILSLLKREAERAPGEKPLVITFDRHPLSVVAPDRAPLLIMPTAERDRALREGGFDVVVVEFTESLRRLTAAEWLARMRDDYGVRTLVLGYDNRFGSDGRNLTTAAIAALAAEAGIRLVEAPKVEGCSSSAIRRALAEGRTDEAAAILGRRYSLSGTVVRGRQIGRTIGVPTANVEPDGGRQLPAPGVYAATSPDADTSGPVPAVVNIGHAPTVATDGALTIEAHLIAFDGDLYGRRLTLDFGARLRDERKFGSLEELRARIAADIENATLNAASLL